MMLLLSPWLLWVHVKIGHLQTRWMKNLDFFRFWSVSLQLVLICHEVLFSIKIYNAFSGSAMLSTLYSLQCFLITTAFFHPYPKLSGINQIVSLNFVVCRKASCLYLQCPDRSEPFRCVYMTPHPCLQGV